MRDAEERVRERGQARAVARFDFRPDEKVQELRFELEILRDQRAGRLGARLTQLGAPLIRVGVEGEVAFDAEKFVEVPDDRSLKPLLGGEARVNLFVRGIDLPDCRVADEDLDFRNTFGVVLLRRSGRNTARQQKHPEYLSSHVSSPCHG